MTDTGNVQEWIKLIELTFLETLLASIVIGVRVGFVHENAFGW